MPPAERPPALVWRRGDALLAAEVDAVLEVAPADGDRVDTREGAAPFLHLPGLPREPAPRAVVLRSAAGLVALPADGVDGIRAVVEGRVAPTPPWLRGFAPDYIRAIVTLDDDRLAVLLAVDALRPGP